VQTNAPTLDERLLDVIGHLGAALVQSTDRDDPIIMGHVQSANDLLVDLRRSVLPLSIHTIVGGVQ
jgi:hypothetical protein